MCVTGLTLLFGEPCDPCPPLSWRQSCEVQFSISLNLSAFFVFWVILLWRRQPGELGT